jgi:hypothetical protein
MSDMLFLLVPVLPLVDSDLVLNPGQLREGGRARYRKPCEV